MSTIIETKKETFNLGEIKIDKHEHFVDVEITLETYDDGKEVFSASGNVYGIYSGQCLDFIMEHINELKYHELFRRIYYFWKRYHLNNMHAGTKRQEDYLKTIDKFRTSYDKRCEILKEVGLHVDIYESKPYTYGHEWIYYPIPDEDLKEIKYLFTLRNNINFAELFI